jgi:hypothetical protein
MIDELLRRFPEPVTLQRSRGKWFGILAGCAVFVTLGILMIANPASFRSYHGIPPVVAGWSSVVFFGSGVVVSIVVLIPGMSHLTFDARGFTVCNMFRRSTTPWQHAGDFAAVNMALVGSRKLLRVGYNDRSAAAQRTLARANAALVGRNSSLPDTYGLTAEDLARLMSLWRVRALS